MELEHLVGFNGEYARTSLVHPLDANVMIYAAGASVVMEQRNDAHQQQFLKFHDATVNGLAISEDGTILVSSQGASQTRKGNPSSVAVWNLRTLELQAAFEGLNGEVLSCDVSPDGRFVAASTAERVIHIWDLHTGDVVLTRRTEVDTNLLRFGPVSRLASASGGMSKYPAYTLAAAVGKDVFIMQVEYDVAQVGYAVTGTDQVLLPTVANMQRRYLSASWAFPLLMLGNNTGELTIVNAAQRVFRAALPIATNGVTSITRIVTGPASGANDALEFLVGGGDGTVQRVRLVGGPQAWATVLNSIGAQQQQQQLAAHMETSWEMVGAPTKLLGATTSMSVFADAQAVLVGTSAGRLYQVLTASLMGAGGDPVVNTRAFAHRGSVTTVSTSPISPHFFATGSTSGEALVWSLEDYSVRCHTEFNSPVTSVYLSKFTLIVGYEDGNVRGFVLDADGHAHSMQGLEYNPHGPALRNAHTQGVHDQSIHGGNARIGATNAYQSTSMGAKNRAPGSNMPASVNAQWTIPTAHKGGVTAVCELGDGAFIVTGGGDGTVRVWNGQTRTFLQELSGTHRRPITGLNPDVEHPTQVGVVSAERIVSKWDVRNGKKISIHTVAASEAGALLGISQRKDAEFEIVTSTGDGKLVFWDKDYADPRMIFTETGTPTPDPAYPGGSKFNCVAVSPSGRFVSAGSQEGEVRVWAVESGEVIFVGAAHSVGVRGVAWTCDEKQMVSGAEDGTVAVWNVFA